MNALQRRRQMMMQTAEEAAPLYQIFQGAHTATGDYRTITITDNHVYDDFGRSIAANHTRYIRLDGTTATFDEVITTTWFSLHAGDVVTMRRKNATFENKYSGASATCQIILKDIEENNIVSLSMTASSRATITPDDAETSVTLENDTDMSCILFYTNRTSLAVYDLELEVNGVRYI